MNNAIVTSEEQNAPAVAHMGGSALTLDIQAMQTMQQMAEIMAGGVATVPKHLQKNKSDCLAVIMQATRWGMDPYAVAQKTHLVQGTLGYEAQLVNAVISSSSAIIGSFHYDWFGDWSKVIGKFQTKQGKNGPYQAPGWSPADEVGLGITVSATLKGESEPRVLELLLSQAQVRNSTLWASDPKQQLAYLAVKRWARLYAPAVILGVYSTDELATQPPAEHVINPQTNSESLNALLGNADQAPKLSEEAQALEASLRECGSMTDINKLVSTIRAETEKGRISESDRVYLQGVYTECVKLIKEADAIVAEQSNEE